MLLGMDGPVPFSTRILKIIYALMRSFHLVIKYQETSPAYSSLQTLQSRVSSR